MLLLADGYSYTATCEHVDGTAQTIATWKGRYQADGIGGLRGRHRRWKPRVLTPHVEARILSWTRKRPTDGTIHWSTRRLGDKLGVPHTIVARAWKRAGLQPHRLERYLRSTDPRFRSEGGGDHWALSRSAATCGLFCVDEQTAIQWIGATLFCRCRLAARNATVSNTFAMGRCRSMRRSRRKAASCWERRPSGSE
jgi:transposase